MKFFMSRNKWRWGFSEESESWNGRLAMLSFVVIILLELLCSVSVVSILGFSSI
nr:CAB/ELIP/HLIP superfamily protein [Gloiopeltis furcata]